MINVKLTVQLFLCVMQNFLNIFFKQQQLKYFLVSN